MDINQTDFVTLFNATTTLEEEAKIVGRYPENAAHLIKELRHWYAAANKRVKELKEKADA